MTSKRLRWAFLGATILPWSASCFGLQLPIELTAVPQTADSIFVLADGEGVAAPLGGIATVSINTPKITFWLPSVPVGQIRLRAIAFAGASVFPVVTAIGTSTYDSGQATPPAIAMGWFRPLLQKIAEEPNGVTTFLATFGNDDFFRPGAVAELWISSSPSTRNCSGSHYLATLFETDKRWHALFAIPTSLLSAGSSIQLAYHALDFRKNGQTPLFVWPNRNRNEPPLPIDLQESHRASNQPKGHDQRNQQNVKVTEANSISVRYLTSLSDGQPVRISNTANYTLSKIKSR